MNPDPVAPLRWVHRLIPPLQDELYAYAQALTRSRDTSYEVVNQAVAEALELPEPPAPRPFLFAVVRHRAIDVLRRSRTHRRLFCPNPEATELFGEIDERAWPALSESEETVRVLRAAIARLPDDQATALAMQYFEGLNPTTIAAILGVPSGTIRARVCRALIALRTALGVHTCKPPQETDEPHRTASRTS